MHTLLGLLYKAALAKYFDRKALILLTSKF